MARAAQATQEVLDSVLRDLSDNTTPTTEELEARARARGEAARKAILEARGQPLTPAEVGRLLDVGEGEVETLRSTGQLLGLLVDGGYLYPAWQFRDSELLPGLADVLRALPTANPWMKAAFLLGTNTYLGRLSPLTELERGHLSSVVQAARALGEHGAA